MAALVLLTAVTGYDLIQVYRHVSQLDVQVEGVLKPCTIFAFWAEHVGTLQLHLPGSPVTIPPTTSISRSPSSLVNLGLPIDSALYTTLYGLVLPVTPRD